MCHAAPSGAKRFCPTNPLHTFDGRIHCTRWTDQEDIERFGVEIIADEVTFLSYGKSRQQQNAASQDNEDDDIPF